MERISRAVSRTLKTAQRFPENFREQRAFNLSHMEGVPVPAGTGSSGLATLGSLTQSGAVTLSSSGIGGGSP